MPDINSTQFGSVTIDNKKYNQVLIIGDNIEEREYSKLKELFNTSHQIGDWEQAKLVENDPEVIIIGTGQSGMLEVDDEFVKVIKERGIELVIKNTPEAIEVYNELIGQGKKVNALIHTTC